jgi:hypothetical protein
MLLLADISCFESDTKEGHCELASWARLYAFVGGKKKKDDVVVGLYCLVAQYSFLREQYFGILLSLKTHTDQFVESINIFLFLAIKYQQNYILSKHMDFCVSKFPRCSRHTDASYSLVIYLPYDRRCHRTEQNTPV